MRKQIIALALGFVTIGVMAQKKELKVAEKAIKNQDYIGALSAIKSIEGIIANADDKYKSKYYFLKGQALAGKKDYQNAAKSFKELMAFEKSAKKRYTDKAAPILNQMISEVSNRAINLYGNKDYKNATNDFYTTYLLSPTDTSFLFNAAISASRAKDYDASLKYYNELKDINYTGVKKTFEATDKESGKIVTFGSKNEMKLMMKSGKYSNPSTKFSKSKRVTIIKNIGLILAEQGKVDEAILAVKEARMANPKDLNLLLTEADLYIKLEKMDKFAELMTEAIQLDPNNPTLYYNLGVVNASQKRNKEAIKYYKKAIELRPDYADAYMNLSAVILSKEKGIIDEMNNNLSNFKKYDELEKQQKNLYKEALPYLEKADSSKRSIDTVKSLLNIYEILEMEEKAKEFRVLYKSMK